MADNNKGYISRPPTPEQTERIRLACATTRLESEDRETILREIGYEFRTVAGSTGFVAQVKSRRRGWRSVASARVAIKAALKLHGVNVSDPVTMFGFEGTIERLCWANQETDIDDWDSGRFPYYWEDRDVHLERLAD